jgi:sugar lactone lactonase YvrE
VVAVALDAQSRIWVLERQAQEIRVFERDGRHVRTFGRKGGGPGEFQDPLGMAFGPGERLWVVDPQRGRTTVFDTTGAVIATHRTRGGHSVMPWPGGFDRRGDFYDAVADSADIIRSLMARYDTAFRLQATLRPPRWEDPDAVVERVSPDGRSRSRMILPFAARAVWALTPDGDFWSLHTGEYRLDRVSPAGDTLRTVHMPARPVAVSAKERNATLAVLRRNRGGIDEDRIPKVKPPVKGLFVADDGYLWVSREGTGAESMRRADVFDPEGRYLGTVDLPFQLMAPVVFRGDHLATVVWGPMGVHFVALARIDKPAPDPPSRR